MSRCLSVHEIDEWICGRMPELGRAVVESHLDQCPACRQNFLELTNVSDADAWHRAALEIIPPTLAERAVLDQLKKLAKSSAHAQEWEARSTVPSDGIDPLSESVHDVLAPNISYSRSASFPEIPGYEILGELGRGGMGVVYKARQLAYDRIVALKMILAERNKSPEDLGRFHDEAEAISRLRHPHIVQIFEVGEFDGRFYFALEYLEGGSLADFIRDRRVSPRACAQLVEALARAMHYAHQRGIIHRDLKPANVLLHERKALATVPAGIDFQSDEWDFRRLMPKITDFGLAKLLDRHESNGRTSSGDIVGTPSYMAPEQAKGLARQIGPQTDVYALGAILYEMLTGCPPFLGATPMDTLFQVHTAEPTPPRQLNRDVPPELETICLKCLRKEMHSRYFTAEALADDLRRFLHGLPIRTHNLREISQGGTRRWRSKIVLVTSTMLLAVIAGIGAYELRRWFAREPTASPLSEPPAPSLPTPAPCLHDNEVRLRLRLAQIDADKGDVLGGLVQMVRLLEDIEHANISESWRIAVTTNLSLWLEKLPRLYGRLPSLARDLEFDASSGDLWILDENRDFRRMSQDGSYSRIVLPDVGDIQQLSVTTRGQAIIGFSPTGLQSWNLKTERLVQRLPIVEGLQSASISPTGDVVLVRADREENTLWLLRRNSATDSARIEPLRVDRSATSWLWHPSGTQVLVGYADGRLELIPIDQKEARYELRRIAASIQSLAWLNKGKVAVVGGLDGLIRFVPTDSTDDKHELSPIQAHPPGPMILAAGGTDRVVSFGPDGVMRVWSVSQGTPLFMVPVGRPLRKLVMSYDGQRIAFLDTARQISVWSIPDGSQRLLRFPADVSQVQISNDDRWAVALTSDSKHKLLLSSLDHPHEPPVPLPLSESEQCRVFRFEPTGNALVMVIQQGKTSRLQRWTEKGAPLGRPQKLGEIEIQGLELSSNGQWAIAWSGERLYRWDLTKHRLQDAVFPEARDLRVVRVSPDGRQLISSNQQGTKLWHWGEEMQLLGQTSTPIVEAEWTEQSRELRVWDRNYQSYVWKNVGDPSPRGTESPKESSLVPSKGNFVTVVRGRGVNWHQGPQVEPIAWWPAAELRRVQSHPRRNLVLTAWGDGVRLFDTDCGCLIGPRFAMPELCDARWSRSGSEIIAWSPREIRIWQMPSLFVQDATEWRARLRERCGVDIRSDGSWQLHYELPTHLKTE